MEIIYNTAVKRAEPHNDLYFEVSYGEVTKEFTFPPYNPTRPFTEEEYNEMIKAEIVYEMSLIVSPPVEPEPEQLGDF